jgi:hypothetical protein
MKKYFKLFIVIFVAIISFSFINVKTSADTGPKPYVSVTIQGDTKGMYMTLLSAQSQSGPFSSDENYAVSDTEINSKFRGYEDKDHFNYLNYYSSIEGGSYKWVYYPPYTFKFLIYDSLNDRFITDDVINERYAFGSTYIITLNSDILTASKDYPNSVAEEPRIVSPTTTGEAPFDVKKDESLFAPIMNFFVRLIICLAIEIGVALLFKFRKLELVVILLANLVTQIALNVFLSIYIFNHGYQPIMVILTYMFSEIAILLIECIAYLIFIKLLDRKRGYAEKSSLRIILYTLTANVASLALGFVVLTYIPII